MAWTLIGALAVWALLFLWLGFLSGFATSYNVTLGRASAFDPAVHGGHTAKTVAAILAILGWLALPAVVGVLAAGYVDRHLSVKKQPRTPEEREEEIYRALQKSGEGHAGPWDRKEDDAR